MSESQKDGTGRYVPDYEKLKKTAFSEEFAYNMVYITKCKCERYEIFQCPANAFYPVEENLSQAAEYVQIMNAANVSVKGKQIGRGKRYYNEYKVPESVSEQNEFIFNLIDNLMSGCVLEGRFRWKSIQDVGQELNIIMTVNRLGNVS